MRKVCAGIVSAVRLQRASVYTLQNIAYVHARGYRWARDTTRLTRCCDMVKMHEMFHIR